MSREVNRISVEFRGPKYAVSDNGDTQSLQQGSCPAEEVFERVHATQHRRRMQLGSMTPTVIG